MKRSNPVVVDMIDVGAISNQRVQNFYVTREEQDGSPVVIWRVDKTSRFKKLGHAVHVLALSG